MVRSGRQIPVSIRVVAWDPVGMSWPAVRRYCIVNGRRSDKDSGSRFSTFLTGCFTGAIVGGLLGVMLAPLWGEITRRKVTRGAGATKDKAAATKDQVVEAVEQQMESMKEKRETDDADQATDH